MDLTDRIIAGLDSGLRTLFSSPKANRHAPEHTEGDSQNLTEFDQKYAASLMRVNHAGEVCAQALYQGQALTSRSAEVKEKMRVAADEEIDHLNWCETRLSELASHTSHLNPLWYSGSLCIGILAGLAGDKWSLGFLAETERQVVAHLQSHLDKLPEDDHQSRAIVRQMIEDEAQHATMAVEEGAAELPDLVKEAMRLTAKIMTSVAARI